MLRHSLTIWIGSQYYEKRLYYARIVKNEKPPDWRVERHAPRGGGKRNEVRVALNSADLDAKMPRGIEAKSVSGKMYCYTPLSRISNAHKNSQRTATSSLGEVVSQADEFNSLETVHSPLTTHHSLKCVAFTLAEVLITLGIIGVVAALTIPNIIKHYQNEVTVTKLQKAYSTLNQAFRQSENDNGSSEFWQETPEISAQDYFEKYWKPYLKEPKLCQTHQECGYTSWKPYIALNGSSVAMSLDSARVKIKTIDDVFYLFTEATTNSEGKLVPFRNVFIDINGAKAPNKFGEDVFAFNRVIGKGIMPACYNCSYNSLTANCNRKSNGVYCAARIMADGWKIKY